MIRPSALVRLFVASLTAITIAGVSSVVPAQQPVAALRARRALAIEDYYRIKTIGGVTLSPDAKWVAFTVSTRVEETNGNRSEAWVVPWDGSSAAQRLSSDTANATAMSWSDDSKVRFTMNGRTYLIDPATPGQLGVETAAAAAVLLPNSDRLAV